MLQQRVPRPIVAAISGGVDSAVAASLSSSDCGIFMSNWISDTTEQQQCSTHDERDAHAVAQHLEIPLRRLSFAAEYWVQVFEPYIHALDTETGNPDVACNRYIKFGALTHKLREIHGNDYSLVTGHYARLWKRDDLQHVPDAVQSTCSDIEIDLLRQWMADDVTDNLLLEAADLTKDQSYFLATCQADALRNVMFPIGDFCSKREVRNTATQLGLPNATKRDSVGLCFVPKQKSFPKFLSEYIPLPTRTVRFVDVDSNEIVSETTAPTHAFHYTRGQGAKLGGATTKYFCVATDESSNTVTVCQGTHHPSLYSTICHIDAVVWWTKRPPTTSTAIRVLCRTRHLVPLVPATLIGQTVHFDTPVRAITPGQYAVFYIGAVCLGGAKVVGYGNE